MAKLVRFVRDFDAYPDGHKWCRAYKVGQEVKILECDYRLAKAAGAIEDVKIPESGSSAQETGSDA